MRLKSFHLAGLIALASALLTSSVGLFADGGPGPLIVRNQYGDMVRLYGQGLYAYDSHFRAPIFRGTDLIVLLLCCPLLAYSLGSDLRKGTLKARMLLIAVLTVVLYYGASIAFGVSYNSLHLVYILLFSASFFGLIGTYRSIPTGVLASMVQWKLPIRGLSIFLVITGAALLAAWLPEILLALKSGRPPALIETYTTEITYVLDLGIIVPLCFIALSLLRRRNPMAHVLLAALLLLCIVIGIMLPVQTLFQLQAGIELPVPVLITKMASFCILAAFALYFFWRLTGDVDSAGAIHSTESQSTTR
ncbi:hypothetical protein [Flaviaesturariibacter amylovorans]|uniref:DUF998 domain-containing protein n=1 Tax=Flaviaesturariibacter amylovorans TaxID=1084520 RepID=A0ABP8H5Y7_9BACT